MHQSDQPQISQLKTKLMEEKLDVMATAELNEVDFPLDFLIEAKKMIDWIVDLEFKENNDTLRTAYIYYYIALSDLNMFSNMKLAMKFIAIEQVFIMISSNTFNLDETSKSSVNMNKYMCDNCTCLAASYRCSRCHKSKYCSRSCQKHLWKEHKAQCSKD